MAKTKRSFDAELRDSKIQRETLWMKVDDPLENFRVRIEAGTERSLQKWAVQKVTMGRSFSPLDQGSYSITT